MNNIKIKTTNKNINHFIMRKHNVWGGGGGGGKHHIFYQTNRKILEFSKISVLDFKATAVRL